MVAKTQVIDATGVGRIEKAQRHTAMTRAYDIVDHSYDEVIVGVDGAGGQQQKEVADVEPATAAFGRPSTPSVM